MKMLVQGDDFGITRAATLGIVDCIDRGILRNTGLFANSHHAEFACSFMKDRPQACFGIDFNFVTGPALIPHEINPHLTDENGNFHKSNFYSSNPLYHTKEGQEELIPFDELDRELRAQYDRFVELTGRKPGYLHPHSLGSDAYFQIIRNISAETGVPYSYDLIEKYGMGNLKKKYNFDTSKPFKREFDPKMQMGQNVIQRVLDQSEAILNYDYFVLGGHPGYVDGELLDITTLSIERARDAEMMMSPLIKEWVEANHIELITYYDLY